MPVVLQFLAVLCGLRGAFGLFIPDNDISPCYGLNCKNGGSLNSETCSCQCAGDYEGALCETEIRPSSWPDGSYSLLSTVFGCPELEGHGWKPGYVNLTVSADTKNRQWFPEVFRMLGPYHLHTIQLNFCTRARDRSNPEIIHLWSSGNYCIFKEQDENCPKAFGERSLPLKDYGVWHDDIGGVVPDINISDDGITLTLCCRDDGVNGTAIDLPVTFPFYLLKPSSHKPCQDVNGMVTTEEDFSFMKTTNRTWLERDGSFTVEESDLYFNLTFCYYEPYERRECMYSEDNGASYRGLMNVTSDGRPCPKWDKKSYLLSRSNYLGHYEVNYCRQPWRTESRPYCMINNTNHFCDIPICDASDDFPNVVQGKFFRSAPTRGDEPVQNIANGVIERPPFSVARPYIEPWVQVDLQEDYVIQAVLIYKAYTWNPYNSMRMVTYVSRHQWDFLRFGAYTCEGPHTPGRNNKFRFQCRRTLIGSFVTVQSFVHNNPFFNEDSQSILEISEIVIKGQSTACGKSLGVKSGVIQDFQITSSTNTKGYYAYYVRTNRDTGWCAESTDPRPFIQVDLLTPMVVEGIIIQGWTDGRTARIPDNFTVDYGNKESNLTSYLNSMGETKLFRVDQTYATAVPQKIILPQQLLARIIRLYFYQQSSPVCAKLDLLGCPRKVEFDLKCQKKSTVIGLQSLQGHRFHQMPYNSSFEIRGITADPCREGYLSNTALYGGYSFDSHCMYPLSNRYSRHNRHWWTTGLSSRTQYGQLMCIKNVSDATDCDGILNSTGEIVSPSYPFYYGENINCRWSVYLPLGSFVTLELIDVNLAEKEELFVRTYLTDPVSRSVREVMIFINDYWNDAVSNPGVTKVIALRSRGSSCYDHRKPMDTSTFFDCEDTLAIHDKHRQGDQLVAIITRYPVNTLEGPRYISSSNEIAIILVSCHRVKEAVVRGFKIKVDSSDCGGCGQGESSCSKQATCTDQCGYISSPDFPNYYPVSSSCQWRIQGRMGQYVTVTFDMIDVIGEGECEGDYVNLFDLDLSEQRSLLGKICKCQRPIGEINSNWHLMDVEFYSDFQNAGRGFLLKYTLTSILLTSKSLNYSGVCNDTWYEYDRRCYSFSNSTEGLSWIDAEKRCNQDGGHLVSISNPDEMMFLHSTIVNDNLFTGNESYIGLRKAETGELGWTDGKPLTHTEWYAGDRSTPKQPDGFDKESCTMMKISGIRSTANWHDVACAFDKIHQYICEIDTGTSATNNETAESQIIPQYAGMVKEGYYFQCSSGEHISRLYVCDDSLDCSDGSDEQNCTNDHCPPGMFSCTDGGCVDVTFYCDHRPHCQDGSDEDNCVNHECDADQLRCASGQCVSSQQRCDLIEDCVDGTDEQHCERCQGLFFQCYDGRCLPPARVCDGFVDCGGQYREDEGPQCTTNSQPSCSAWHALGARQNGRYIINMKGDTDSHPVECVFDSTEGMIATIIHHTMEDLTVTGSLAFNETVNYTLPDDVIANVMSSASKCRQRVQFECLQSFDIYKRFSLWYDVNGKPRSFRSETGSDCSCLLKDQCNENNTKCVCDKIRQEYFMVDDSVWLTDSGYLDDKDRLPITRLWITRHLRFGRLRHNIGPLICEENIQTTTLSLLCKSGVVVDIAHKCVLDYDIYHHHKGCRDLTHLQSCEDFKCPTDHIKCPSSFCIPLRLVCDGHLDCADGMDEMGCDSMTCPGRFSCHGNNVCIPWQQVCDGLNQCQESDDEYFCNSTCLDECVCDGSYITCSNLNLDNTELLPTLTRVLNLSKSLNKTITNHTFRHMENLAVLDLSYLGVYELEKYCFGGLDNLLSLDLSMNHLEEIPNGVFSSMRNLKKLLLTGNKIIRLYMGSFGGLNVLPSLDLSNMALTMLLRDTFQGLPNLLFLNVSGNSITNVEDGSFRGIDSLQSLDLRDNSITRFTGGIFMGLNELTSLYNDRYVFCCFRPASVSQDQCLPQADEFSSCSDLMRNEALRISMWVLGFIALAGNILVIITRRIYDKRRRKDAFVTNLAMSDFFMGVYMIIIASADAHYRGVYSWNDLAWRTSWVCQLAGFLASLSSETSVMFLCMITMERVLVIKFPFRDFTFFKTSSAYVALFVWLLGILFAGIPLLPMSYFSGTFYSRSGVCLALPLTRNRPPGWEYSTAIFVFWNSICFLVIALGQAVIYHTVKASQKIRKGKTNKDMVIARKLSFIVLTDFVCWFPICVMGLMALGGQVIVSEVYAWVAVFVLPINSALNPVIYTLSSIDTKRKEKTTRGTRGTMISKVEQNTVAQSRKTVSQLLKKEYLCLAQPSNSVTLTSYLSTLTSPRDLVIIAQKLAMTLDDLHNGGLVSGDIDTDSVYVILDNGRVSKVVTSCVPMATDSDEVHSNDMLDFGHLVSKMLRAYTVSKLHTAKN